MTTDFTRYVPLKQVVAYVMDELELDHSQFDRLWVMAFRGLVEMHYDISAEVKTLRLPVLPNKTVVLPVDYLGYSKIGLLNEHGEVVTIRVNNALSTYRDSSPNRLSSLTPDINNSIGMLSGTPTYFNYYLQGTYQTYYGTAPGLVQYGECKVDEKNNVILFNIDFRWQHIILEYISSPQKNSDYDIPMTDQEAIIAFVKWKLKAGNPRELERMYYNEVSKARKRKPGKKVVLQELNAVLRESNGMKLRS